MKKIDILCFLLELFKISGPEGLWLGSSIGSPLVAYKVATVGVVLPPVDEIIVPVW